METKWSILVSNSLIVDKGWRKIYNLGNLFTTQPTRKSDRKM